MFLQKIPKAILWGGLICGTLDITAALIDVKVNFHMTPVHLLQNVASSLMGPVAYDSGASTAALGLVMHFTVAYTFTTIFYFLARSFPVLLRHPIVSGLIYGAIVFLIMYRVVLPLTLELKTHYVRVFNHAWPPLRWSQFFVHLFCVGLPISLTVRAKGVGR